MNNVSIKRIKSVPKKENVVLLGNKKSNYESYGLSKVEAKFVSDQINKNDKNLVSVNQFDRWIYVYVIEEKKEIYQTKEACRKKGNDLLSKINFHKIKTITLVDIEDNTDAALAFAEGLALGSYQFLKYFKDAEKKKNALKTIQIYSKKMNEEDIHHLQIITDATCFARTLVNEPLSYLTAPQLSKEIKQLGKEAGCKVEVLEKAKISALKMGGLLAVNKGSVDPPTFNIMTWNPKNAKNKNPYVLVGKGLTFDSGGLNIKTRNMEEMKCDMAGGATVACTMYAIAKAKLPIHVIGLIPATDNKPSGNAYAPGDVIKMHNGLTVEIISTDAEGRMILADALSYAQQYKPELVIDLATLTGSAYMAVGPLASTVMGTADKKTYESLKTSGNNVYERVVEFPFFDEYDEMIKSDIADIKNGAGGHSGAITAGKFLEHFTDYPWIHIDIAGPAYLLSRDSYRAKGGTGIGIRLLFDFFRTIANN